MSENKISDKHKQFVEDYLRTNNATQSYVNIYGIENRQYATTLSWKVLQRPDVKEYLNIQQDKIQKNYDISKEKMIDELFEVIKECKKPEGNKDKNNWLRAIEIINRIAGNYTVTPNLHLNQTNYNISFGGVEGRKLNERNDLTETDNLDDYEEEI